MKQPCIQQALDLNLIPLINAYATVTTPDLDVGQLLVLAATNRVCDPGSKNKIGAWYGKTILPCLFTIPVTPVTGQRFRDAMNRLPLSAIPRIEEDLWEKPMDSFGIPLDWLIYDTTNFFSYLAEQTPSDLYEKGNNKASLSAGRVGGVGCQRTGAAADT